MSENWRVGARQARYAVADEVQRAKLIKLGIPYEFDALSVGTDQRQVAIIPLDTAGVKDAVLISAAPQMLEALKLVNDWLVMKPGEMHQGYEVAATKAFKVKSVIEQAIAKAEGFPT